MRGTFVLRAKPKVRNTRRFLTILFLLFIRQVGNRRFPRRETISGAIAEGPRTLVENTFGESRDCFRRCILGDPERLLWGQRRLPLALIAALILPMRDEEERGEEYRCPYKSSLGRGYGRALCYSKSRLAASARASAYTYANRRWESEGVAAVVTVDGRSGWLYNHSSVSFGYGIKPARSSAQLEQLMGIREAGVRFIYRYTLRNVRHLVTFREGQMAV